MIRTTGQYGLDRLSAIAARPLMGLGLLSALLLGVTSSSAQTSTDAAVAAGENFLWQIETPTNTVYLLGSVHFLSADQYPLPAVMEAAFDEAEVLVLEADISAAASADAATVMIDAALPEPGESLAEVLTPDTYELAQQQVAELGLPFGLFEGFEPWFLAVSLTSFQLIDIGFEPEYGIDQYFHGRATDADKPVLFLETVEQQFNLFEQLSIDEQRQFTEQALAEMDLLEESFNEILTAWSTGDIAGLEATLFAGFADYPEMQAIFLSDRNRDWATQIQPFLQADDDYLIVVGALHLVGPDNVLELLAQQGYQAEQL
ncbi:MAG: TraB/GumN family protein [Leptolyngbyaceae cyanobacterium]